MRAVVAGAGLDGAVAAGAGAAGGGAEFDADEVAGADTLAAGAFPIVTSGAILLIVDAETPAFDKSLIEEKGRAEMIFFAVASPTPGNSFRSAALAVFRSTLAPVEPEAAGFAVAAGLLAAGFIGAAVGPPNVTKGVIFLIVEAETPAFDKSSTEEYGRPAIIFLAVAAPTPGRVSNSFSLALFRSICALEVLDCVAGREAAVAGIARTNTKTIKNKRNNL